MQSRIRVILVCLAVLTGVIICGAQATSSDEKKPAKGKQAGKEVNIKSTAKVRGAGPDTNIKNDKETNDMTKPAPAPPDKGGAKMRGPGPYPCRIHVDNHSPWVIRVYIDGDFSGGVTRYGDGLGLTGNGPTTLYATATFTDGTVRSWGPDVVNCEAYTTFHWRLYRAD